MKESHNSDRVPERRLALQRLPARDYASLKHEDDAPRFTITDPGRRALWVAEMFDTSG